MKAPRFPPVDSVEEDRCEGERSPCCSLPIMNEGRRWQRDPEIKILTDMFSTRDEAGRQIPTRLEAFLAIVRLEKHWGRQLE